MAKKVRVLTNLTGKTLLQNQLFNLPVYAGGVGTIVPGDIVIKDGSHAGYFCVAPDACADTSKVMGIAVSTSTDTAAANGTVDIQADKVMVVEIYAKTPASLTVAMVGEAYILDNDGTNMTLDQATSTNGILRIIKYDNVTNGLCTCALNTNW